MPYLQTLDRTPLHTDGKLQLLDRAKIGEHESRTIWKLARLQDRGAYNDLSRNFQMPTLGHQCGSTAY